jgi:hypothetical protein
MDFDLSDIPDTKVGVNRLRDGDGVRTQVGGFKGHLERAAQMIGDIKASVAGPQRGGVR